jgi:hypothetical protein
MQNPEQIGSDGCAAENTPRREIGESEDALMGGPIPQTLNLMGFQTVTCPQRGAAVPDVTEPVHKLSRAPGHPRAPYGEQLSCCRV